MASARHNTPGNARNGQGAFNSYFKHPDGYEYCIIVNHDWHPVVWQRDYTTQGAEWVSHDVYDTVIDLIEVSDSHQGISIGVSADGIIHVSGNTHDTMMRHIRSVNPHDITEWETAPMMEKHAMYFTNLIENGVVENNTDGWTPTIPARYTMDRVTHSYGWGSTHGNDTNCKALRLTRTADNLNATIGQGIIYSISNTNGFTATPGEKYSFSLSMRCAGNYGSVRFTVWLIFRGASGEISRVSAYHDAPNSSKWYRPYIPPTTAPAGTTHVRMEFRALKNSGNAVAGNAVWADGAMLIPGETEPGDIVYRDGAFNGGYQETGWEWNGTPYASSSTGPIRTEGYAGLPMLGYNRYLPFSDGTLVMSGSQPIYVNDPVGRRWSMFVLKPGETNFKPFIGEDGVFMRNVESYVKQGSNYPVLSEGNEIDGGDNLADRAYAYHTYIDKDDVFHAFAGFRMWSNHSYAQGMYVRSTDKGATWETIEGNPVTMPIRQTVYGDPTGPEILVDGEPIYISTGSNVAIDKDGHPHMTYRSGNHDGNSPSQQYHLFWDGTQWVQENFSEKYSFATAPSISIIRDEIWLFGAVNVNSTGLAVWGVNYTQDSGYLVRAGNVNVGTPDGVYQFESGCQYEGAMPYSGGMENGQEIYRASIPDNESPRIFTYGAGLRGRLE